jgi:hypothetical protein
VAVAALPALLRRVDDDAVAGMRTVPSATARARLVTTAQSAVRRQQRRRRSLAVAAVLPVVLVSALVTALPRQSQEAGPELVAMKRVNAALQVDGALAAEGRSWGTEVTVRMRWAKEASAVLVAVGRDGREQEAGWWRAPAGEDVRCQGATSLQPAAVARWEVRTADGAPLLVLAA